MTDPNPGPLATPPYVRSQGVRVCICGHLETAHTNLGKHTTCFKTHHPKCNCEGGFRPVVLVYSAFRVFQRTARGGDRPHALYGAIEKLEKSASWWDWIGPLECDFCHKTVDSWRDLMAYALDERDAPMFSKPGSASGESSLDTGHHALLCGSCETQQREIAKLEASMKQAAEDAEFEAALRAAGGVEFDDHIRSSGD